MLEVIVRIGHVPIFGPDDMWQNVCFCGTILALLHKHNICPRAATNETMKSNLEAKAQHSSG